MIKKFIDIDRIKRLQELINFLDSYKTSDTERHHIGPNINTENVRETKLLNELGRLNVRRDQIIEELMNS